jgi:predicted RecA/RadA family phage recombinase
MQAVLVQSIGNQIDYTPSADVAAGEVIIQGDLVGVAHRPIPANTPGALVIGGVLDFAKPTSAGSASGMTVGIKVYWDDTNNVATVTAGSNKQIGKIVKVAADGDAAVRCLLSQ